MPTRINRPVAAMTGVLTLVAGYATWLAVVPRDVAHVAIVADRSPSPAFSVCDAVTAMVGHALTMPTVTKESQLTLIATGDAGNDFQGRLVRRAQMPKRVAVIHSQKTQRLREQAFIEDLVARCNELPPTDRSPILYAIAAAVTDLRGLGCREGAGCRIDVVSDGNENLDPALAAALMGDQRAVSN